MKRDYQDRYIKIGLNIAYYRKLRGYTQYQLADKLEIEQPHLSRIETASIGFSFDLFFAIADALQVPPYKLLELRELNQRVF